MSTPKWIADIIAGMDRQILEGHANTPGNKGKLMREQLRQGLIEGGYDNQEGMTLQFQQALEDVNTKRELNNTGASITPGELKRLLGWFMSNSDKAFMGDMINSSKFDPQRHALKAEGNMVMPVNPELFMAPKNAKKSALPFYGQMDDHLEFASPEEATWFLNNFQRIWE